MDWRPRRQWRKPPYYKVQVWDEVGMSWRDEKPAFETPEEARDYIKTEVDANARKRLMHVTAKGRMPLAEEDSSE